MVSAVSRSCKGKVDINGNVVVEIPFGWKGIYASIRLMVCNVALGSTTVALLLSQA